MPKKSTWIIALIVAFLLIGASLLIAHNLRLFIDDEFPAFPLVYTYKVVETYPHQTNAFTQGLLFDDGFLYESIGGYGASALRIVDLEIGEVLEEVKLSEEFFGEGLTLVDGSLVQLTWQGNIGFIYDKETLDLLGNFSYSMEGWGLTYDGERLIMSDGTSKLHFLDPVSYKKVGEVTVHDGETLLWNLNELEYINGDIYANIWHEEKIAIINKETGQVKGYIDLSGIYETNSYENTLNGIAYDQKTDRLFVTGKNWPNIYHIIISPQ